LLRPLYVYLFLAAAAGDAQFLMELRPFSGGIKLSLSAQEEIKEEAAQRSPFCLYARSVARIKPTHTPRLSTGFNNPESYLFLISPEEKRRKLPR
jgi:hypothetical protein